MQRGNLGAGVERSTVEQEKEVLQERAPPEPKAANLNGGSKPNRRLKSVLQEAKSAEAEPDLIAAIASCSRPTSNRTKYSGSWPSVAAPLNTSS